MRWRPLQIFWCTASIFQRFFISGGPVGIATFYFEGSSTELLMPADYNRWNIKRISLCLSTTKRLGYGLKGIWIYIVGGFYDSFPLNICIDIRKF